MQTTRRTVLILGANGRFGLAASQAFSAAGWQVLAQARRTPVDGMPAAARHISAGLGDLDALVAVAAGAEVVVHALNPPYPRWAEEVMPLARAGMDLAQTLGARFMLPGNVYNFGAGMPARLSEDTPQRPTTRKGRIRADLEAEMQARAARGLRSVVVRAGDFFGGSVAGNWFDSVIVKSLRSGKLVYPGPLDVPHAWSYLPDFARAFANAARRDDGPAFQSFHFEGHTLTGAQLLDGVESAARSIGIGPARGFRRAGMPWPLIRAGGLLLPMWREIAEIQYLWRVPHALDGSALAARIGVLPATSLDVATRDALLALGFGTAGSQTGPARHRARTG